jgi:hypothetical protein
LSPGHVRLSRRVGTFLSERDQVQQHVQPSIAAAAESVTHLTSARRLNGCHAGQGGDLRHAEAWSRHAEFGDQASSHDHLNAVDPQQRCKVCTDASLDIGAQLELLVHEQRDLVGDLVHGAFTDAIELAQPRRHVGASCLDSPSAAA